MSAFKLPALPLLAALLALSFPVSRLEAEAEAEAAAAKPLSRIHIGSCIRQNRPMPIFASILADDPELFIFLGDNIYADTKDMDLMRKRYAQLGADPGFSLLRKSCRVMAVWDDHDYGENDAGEDYPKKRESQQNFVNFWGDPVDSPRRTREGIYDAHLIGPEGKRVQVILLDTRYFRGKLRKGERRVGGHYYPEPDPLVPMLGDVQWDWLEKQLRVPANLRIIATSIQFVAESAGQETWSNLPSERDRMIDLIAKTGASGVIFVSGDRHWSDLSAQREGAPYPLYDLTSSSLNTVHGRGTPTVNRYREIERTYHQPNFGVIEIDWSAPDPAISLRIHDLHNKKQFGKRLSLSELAAMPE